MFKFTRKLAVVLLALALVFAAAGCGKKDSDGTAAGGVEAGVPAEPASSFEYKGAALGGLIITKYKGTNANVVIPAQIEVKTVVQNQERDPSNIQWEDDDKEMITSIENVKSIGDSAFVGCESITSVTIPNSVKSIGDSAFSNCKSLVTITMPDGLTTIGKSMFSHCRSLTSITIPDSVTSIGEFAFYNCASLTSATIPDGVTSIGTATFSGCTSLTSVTIPEGVTTIGSNAFWTCKSLDSVTIPKSVTSIDQTAFTFCTSLSEESKQQILKVNPNALFK